MSEMALELIRRAKAEGWISLDLGRCGIVGSVPREIGDLENLEELILSDTWWDWEASETKKSQNGGLKNHLRDIPSILPSQIRYLVLSNTQISDITPLKQLIGLKRLIMDNTQVQDISPICDLLNLTSLSISSKNILDFDPLSSLCNLQRLNLYDSQVSDLNFVSGLIELRRLSLGNTSIKDLSPLASLRKLERLYLERSGIEEITPIGQLKNLQRLYLDYTKVADISALNSLQKLRRVGLVATNVHNLFPLMGIIENEIEVRVFEYDGSDGIFIKGCPLTAPPLEIAAQGNSEIIAYWNEQEKQGTTNQYEAKVLILGEGGAGKTTLLKRMLQPELAIDQIQQSTKGIDIHHHHYDIGKSQPMQLNIWDFGGQEIYHTTHQFFLTKRSVYILVDDTVKDAKNVEDDQFRYWLEMIELLGGDSPIFIFQNEKSGRTKGLEKEGIRKRFPFVREFHAGDLILAHSADKLRAAIELAARALPHVEEPWPKQWLAIRKDLEELAKSQYLIPLEEYYAVFAKHLELDRESARTLSRYLHDLGVLLHFQDDALLDRILILQNNWATEAVFRILDNEPIKAKHGYFSDADCNLIWKEARFTDRQIELRQLMMKFELCYELRDVTTPTWLAPQLLQDTRPVLDFHPERGDLVLCYQYEILPKGLVNRLMVRKNRYVANPAKSWRNGVLFESGDNACLVEIPYGKREIHFRARGKEARELLTFLSEDLETLNETFDGLKDKVRKMIPCTCTRCRESMEAHTYNHDDLLARRRAGKATIECRFEPFEEVTVNDLLEGFETSKSKKSIKKDTENPENMKTKLFISYSSDDEKHRIAWDKQTAVLKNLDYIAPWHMRKILPGDKWDPTIRKEMEEADVMVLFISASFFASDFIWKVELARAKERFEAGECEIAIIIVEPCVWRVTWLKDVQALNGGQVIATATHPAEAWARVVEDLMLILEKVNDKKKGGGV